MQLSGHDFDAFWKYIGTEEKNRTEKKPNIWFERCIFEAFEVQSRGADILAFCLVFVVIITERAHI